MKHTILKSLALTAASLAMATAASAATYSLTFNGAGYDVSGILTTVSGGGVSGGDAVQSFAGTITNDTTFAIEALNLFGPAGQFGSMAVGDTNYTWNNTYFGSPSQPLNGDGLLFLAAGGKYWNLYGTGTGFNLATDSPLTNYSGTLAINPVPEPETFAMLLAGLGLMGAIARRRNKLAATA